MPFKDKATRQQWRERNRERIRAQERARYWADPEAAKNRMREWRRRNPGRSAELLRRWRAANPERHRQLVLAEKQRLALKDLEQAKAAMAPVAEARKSERVAALLRQHDQAKHLGYRVVGNDGAYRRGPTAREISGLAQNAGCHRHEQRQTCAALQHTSGQKDLV